MDNQYHLKNPSFSSSLLDRCFDDQTTPAARGATEEDHRTTGKKNMDQNVDMMLFNKLVAREKSACSGEYHFRLNSSSTSSDSSFCTSSDPQTAKSKLAVRTSFSHRKLKNECGGFVKEKSEALKRYGDLKKSKTNQPISPAATFHNSLFSSTGNANKSKIKYTSVNASSFTRSCFSKTPSSRGKLSDGMKRSVSVIMNEDRRYKDNGRHNYDGRNSICGAEIMESNRRARQVLRNYEKKLQECKMMMNDDEDRESYASSDLFELDNLDSVIASTRRYSQELPVYETTSLDANRAIAHGLLMRNT